MTTPKLPPLQPPKVPNSMRKGAEQQPPKSNFFFILMMTFLILWTFKVFQTPEEDPTVALDPSFAEQNAVAPTLTDATRAALPKEFVEAAEKAKNAATPEFITLGSLDPSSPYRMLATLTNRGAAVARIELNEDAYADHNDKTGYLGQIVVDESLAAAETGVALPGVAAQVVGSGTPAAKAGLKPGDRIIGVVRDGAEKVAVDSFDDLRAELLKTRPGDKIQLEIYRGEKLNENVVYRNLIDSVAKMRKKTDDASRFGALEAVETPATDEKSPENVAETAQIAEVEKSPEVAETEQIAETEQAPETVEAESVAEPAKTEFALFGETFPTETLDVELTFAPLSVVGPSGMVADYNDYLNVAGLKAAYYGHDDKLDFFQESGVRKMNGDPASFLTTLASVDGEKLADWSLDAEKNDPARRGGSASSLGFGRPTALERELAGVDLRDGYWEYVAEKSSENVAVFRKPLLERRLEILKKYELVQETPNEKGGKAKNGRGYHLTLTFEVKNVDPTAARSVSYLLDGPTGLPLEGAWFASGRKTGPGWGSYGLRDLVVSMNDGKSFYVVKCWDVADDKTRQSDELDVDFLGIDGQYFQCTAIPAAAEGAANGRFAYSPIRVGAKLNSRPNFTDVSFRMKSVETQLAPSGQAGDSLSQEFVVFAGPKQPKTLDEYGLGKTLVYGWFWFVSIPLLWILHFFNDYVVFNYGLAIVMLTILVRLCVFPLSRKQVASSIKMQKLQPELTALKTKYQDNPQEMMQAQQALFRKHGVNPLSGCLPIFIQMPIFIGLYKALSLDVNLYGAPLFTKSVRWCSNLAAPDMAFDWSGFWNSIGWPSFNMSGNGFLAMFSLGPYLNILPVITIALFLIQQKLLVPPVVGDDEQARQQRAMRKMMNFMMIFMGLMFFKVPSGLCVYFIVSSLWGLLERKMLPKRDLEPVADGAPIDVETVGVGATASVAGFESKKDKCRKYAATGRKYEIYDRKRDAKGRRISSPKDEKPKSKFRAWWDDIVERAQEQQRLAKSEYEDGIRKTDKNNRRRRG